MAEGLISFHSNAYATEDFLAYCPIEIRGKPLSETITAFSVAQIERFEWPEHTILVDGFPFSRLTEP